MRSFIIFLSMLSVVPSLTARFSLLPQTQEPGNDHQLGSRRSAQSAQEQQAERDQVRALNQERQQKLKQDTDKLLKLATELKQYVDKTNENILSLEVLKKTDEIEKLSKSIREKMRTAYDVPREDPIRLR